MKRAATTALVVGIAVLLGMLGVMQVAVAAQHVSVTRSFDTGSVTAGGELDVTIDISGVYGGIGQVVETLPAGFSYVSGSSALVLDENDITVDGSGRQMVPFSLVGERTFTYKVAVSSDAMPPHTFSGVFTYGFEKDMVEIGASSVTVEQPSTSVSASRSFDTTGSVTAGGELDVTIDISGVYGGIGQVVETLPAGFSYVSGSSALVLDENDITVDGSGRQMVPFSLVGETTFTYKVAVSSDEMPPAHVLRGLHLRFCQEYGEYWGVQRNGGAAVHVGERFKVIRYEDGGCWRRVGGDNRHQWRIRGYRPGGGDAARRFQLRIGVRVCDAG